MALNLFWWRSRSTFCRRRRTLRLRRKRCSACSGSRSWPDGPVGETTSKFFKRTAGNRSVISPLEKELKRWLIQRNVKKMEWSNRYNSFFPSYPDARQCAEHNIIYCIGWMAFNFISVIKRGNSTMGWNSKKWWSQRNLSSILKCYHKTCTYP